VIEWCSSGPKHRRYCVLTSYDATLIIAFLHRNRKKKRRLLLHEHRKTPLTCGNRPGTNRRSKPKGSPLDRYTTGSYRRAIHRCCDKVFPPPEGLNAANIEAWRKEHRWSPNQLRHTAAKEIRKRYGLEACQTVLGHASADVTQIYAERDYAKAREIMREVG